MTAPLERRAMPSDADDNCKDEDKSFLQNLKDCMGAGESGVERRD